jgi:hypothetical protein
MPEYVKTLQVANEMERREVRGHLYDIKSLSVTLIPSDSIFGDVFFQVMWHHPAAFGGGEDREHQPEISTRDAEPKAEEPQMVI